MTALADDDRRGGIDLGGTKIEAVVVDARNNVLGSARRPTPTAGGPEDVAPRRSRRRSPRPRTRPGSSRRAARRRRRLARGRRPRHRSGHQRAQPARLGGRLRARRRRCRRELGPPVFVGNDVQVATDAEFELGAGKPYKSLLGVFWGTGRRRWADPRRQAVGRARRRRRDRARGRRDRRGRCAVRAPRGAWRRTPGRAAMEARARERVEKGSKTDLFKLMEERGRTRLTSAIWAQRARAQGQARDRDHRRSGRGARRRDRVGGQPARRRSGDHRRRARRAVRRAVRQANRGRDAAAPVQRREPPQVHRRGAGRPRRCARCAALLWCRGRRLPPSLTSPKHGVSGVATAPLAGCAGRRYGTRGERVSDYSSGEERHECQDGLRGGRPGQPPESGRRSAA